MKLKKCVKCKKEFPMTLEYFFARKQRASGLSSWFKDCHKKYMKGYRAENVQKLKEQNRIRNKKYREQNGREMDVYNNIHQWIRRNKPKQDFCSICNERKKLELANISGEYKKEIKDYIWVCRPCHRIFDKIKRNP